MTLALFIILTYNSQLLTSQGFQWSNGGTQKPKQNCSLFSSQSTFATDISCTFPLSSSTSFVSLSLFLSGANAGLIWIGTRAARSAAARATPSERAASFRISARCTVWIQQLLSAKDKQTDRRGRARRRREVRRMWETWKYVRE